jgi:hypothetical protein
MGKRVLKMTLKRFWSSLLPSATDSLERGRAGLVMITCLGLMAAMAVLILAWLISGDLEWQTAVAGTIMSIILVGFMMLARNGRSRLALWLLSGLLFLLITSDAASFGLGSPAATAYFIPIVLAACGIGLWGGLGMAAAGTTAVWLIAVAAAMDQYTPEMPYEEWHLTFIAPLFTVLFFLVALIVGYWTNYMGNVIQKSEASIPMPN